MIINDFNLLSIIVAPDKTDAPLVVYSDTVLTGTVTAYLFQSVRRWHSQIIYIAVPVKHPQFSECRGLYRLG